MSAAAISAAAMRCRTMADGSLRIEVEVEPADAQAAFAMFGKPGAPMALAALVVGHAQAGKAHEPEPAAKPPTPSKADGIDHTISKWVALRCREPVFWDWIESRGLKNPGFEGWERSEQAAAAWVRWRCSVASRAEFDTSPSAAERFHSFIRGPFSKYALTAGAAA
jgi:hypothetical protein